MSRGARQYGPQATSPRALALLSPHKHIRGQLQSLQSPMFQQRRAKGYHLVHRGFRLFLASEQQLFLLGILSSTSLQLQGRFFLTT